MPADTFSSTLGFLQMGTGNDNNTWGDNANSFVFQIFEDAIANALSLNLTGGTLDLSGSPPPAAASQVRYAALVFAGALGSAQTIQVPDLTKFWWVSNQTSGAFALTMKTPAGSASVAIPQNSGWQLVLCDGSNNIIVSPFNLASGAASIGGDLTVSGDTSISGELTVVGIPAVNTLALTINGVNLDQAVTPIDVGIFAIPTLPAPYTKYAIRAIWVFNPSATSDDGATLELRTGPNHTGQFLMIVGGGSTVDFSSIAANTVGNGLLFSVDSNAANVVFTQASQPNIYLSCVSGDDVPLTCSATLLLDLVG